MQKINVGRRVGLLNTAGVYFLRHLPRHIAEALLRSGAVEASKVQGGEVVECRLIAARISLSSLRQGSFGVHRAHVPVGSEYGLSGGVVFSHHTELYDGIAA